MGNINNNEDIIDLREIVKFIWSKRWFVVSITMIVFLVTLISLLMKPNIYSYEVVVKLGKMATEDAGRVRTGSVFSTSEIKNMFVSTDIIKEEMLKQNKWIQGCDIIFEQIKGTSYMKLIAKSENTKDIKEFCINLADLIVDYGNNELNDDLTLYREQLKWVNGQLDIAKKETREIRDLISNIRTEKSAEEKAVFRGILLRNILSYYRQLIPDLERKRLILLKLFDEVERFEIVKKSGEINIKRPNYKLKLSVAVFAGLFFGVFLSFLIEFFSKFNLKD